MSVLPYLKDLIRIAEPLFEKRFFSRQKEVNHILPYDSPASNSETDKLFEDNRKRLSISGVQENFLYC